MAKKPGIPSNNFADRSLTLAISAMKENIEMITGARPGIQPIAQLSSTAATSDIINKINEIIARINFTGQ